MKTLISILLLTFCAVQVSQAQQDSIALKSFRIWVIPMKRGPVTQGVLYQVKDSAVVVSKASAKSDYLSGNFKTTDVLVKDIKSMQLRKKGAQGTAILIGGLAGATVGILVAVGLYVSPDNEAEKGFQALGMTLLTVMSTGLGVGIGAGVGGIKIHIPIKGSQQKFASHKDRLEGLSIQAHLSKAITQAVSFSKLPQTVKDADGHVYHTMALGAQVWMAENLKAVHYQDGSVIPGTSVADSASGVRYNWFSLSGRQNVCPAGWHVPSLGEWTSFFNSLGGVDGSGDRLDGNFSPAGETAQWWSSTETDSARAKAFFFDHKTVGVMFTTLEKTSMLHARCIRDF